MSILHSLKPRIIELGKIKIGAKDATERTSRGGGTWRAPIKLDHFVITTMQRDPRGDLVPDAPLMEGLLLKHGSPDKHLREIPVALLSDEIEDVLLTNHVAYKGKILAGRCDGDTCLRFIDAQGNPLEEPVAGPCHGEHEKAPWKPHGTFCCVIASGEARWGGVYKFRTTSIISIEQLYSSLLHIQNLTGGVLQGLPLRLVVRPVQVAPEGKATTVYVVHVELRGPDLAQIQTTARTLAEGRMQNRLAVRATQEAYRKMLAAPGEGESADESADVAEEFAPPPDVQTPAPTPAPRGRRGKQAEPPAAPSAAPAGAPPTAAPPPAEEPPHDPQTGEVALSEDAQGWIDTLATVADGEIGGAAGELVKAIKDGETSVTDLTPVFGALLARATTRAGCQNAAQVIVILRRKDGEWPGLPAALAESLQAAYLARQAETK